MRALLLLPFLLMLGWACSKSLDSPLPSKPNGVRDTAGDIRTVLAAGPYTLFDQALLKVSMDTPFAFYTMFVPSDSAMTAAGLTSAAIQALSLDSLYKIMGYYIVRGIYSDTLIGAYADSLTTELPTLRQDVTYIFQYGGYTAQEYQQNLYVSYNNGTLYVNGLPANHGVPPLHASNGWIFPLDHALQAPAQSVWGYIQTRPELSMYLLANELVDSIYSADYFYNATIDSALFNTVTYLPSGYYYPTPENFTVLAPTNAAFAAAGFNTAEDLRSYVVQSVPTAYPRYNYNAMDSVLKEHYLYNPGQNPVFYSDMLYSSRMNDGWLNSNAWSQWAYNYANTQEDTTITPFYPLFTNKSGLVSIQWSRNPAIPPATQNLSPDSALLGTNGIIYEIDQLFYPHN